MTADNVLVVGSGGREHALADKLVQDERVDTVYCAPGNGGTAAADGITNIADGQDITEQVAEYTVDMVVIGPEGPLADGVADDLRDSDVPVFGFSQGAARLESSKAFANRFMDDHGIPTADYAVFDDAEEAAAYLDETLPDDGTKFVKADGLAGGKGVFPATTPDEGRDALDQLESIGLPGGQVVIEDALDGEEITLLAVTDGEDAVVFPPSKDYQTAYMDGGPNTGGMGAYAVSPDSAGELISDAAYETFETAILEPTLDGMQQENMESPGVLYFGLMIDEDDDPAVIEYNARFGDPEAQAVLPLMDSSLYDVFDAAVDDDRSLGDVAIDWTDRATVNVVMATHGYPTDYGDEYEQVAGIADAAAMDDVTVYHMGTAAEDNGFYTDGGRILSMVGIGDTVDAARDRAYGAADRIDCDALRYRPDIGE